MWKVDIEKIREIEKSYGDDLNIGACDKQIEKLSETAKKELNYTLSEQYKDFLKVINGIDFNGFNIYGADDFENLADENNKNGLINNNRFWHENENLRRYIFFGTSSSSWYVYEYATNLYYEMDPSETKYETFSGFDELANKIIKDSLL